MNELCVQIQNKYEFLMDLIEKHINTIWDYDMSTDSNNNNYSFMSSSTRNNTDYSKLGN